MLDRIRHLLPLSLLLPSCLSAGVRNRQQGFTVTSQKTSEERPQKKNLKRKTSKEKPQKKNLSRKSSKRASKEKAS